MPRRRSDPSIYAWTTTPRSSARCRRTSSDSSAHLSLSDAQFEPGSLRIGEQSLLTDPAALDALQPDGFPLARISFDTLAIGTSELAFSLTLLVEARGGFLPLDGIGSAGIRVIPEPTTAALVGLGLLLTGLAAPRVR